MDILNARKEFKEYVKSYNPEDEKIKLKISHIERVATNARKIAETLNLSKEDIELAELIGLLHDIGRFEQVRIYHTFVDKDSINHGECGVNILFLRTSHLPIRNKDKMDIFYVLTFGDKKAIWEKADLSDDKISDEIYREFMEDKYINYKERKTSADILVSHFAYVYDLNFRETIQIVKENNYLEKLYKRFTFNNSETMEKYNNVYEKAKQYMESL